MCQKSARRALCAMSQGALIMASATPELMSPIEAPPPLKNGGLGTLAPGRRAESS
jgi:hypothetical protein